MDFSCSDAMEVKRTFIYTSRANAKRQPYSTKENYFSIIQLKKNILAHTMSKFSSGGPYRFIYPKAF